jgi:CHAT domain-containing protein
LLIVPDDVLINVPFAALPLDGKPLVARFAPSLIPEWTWVPPAARRDRGRLRGVGVAVPTSKAYPEAPRLASADDEVAIVDALARDQGQPLERSASLTETLAALGRADFAHFACHGIFNPEDPFRSGLLLRDGWLTLDELARTRLPRLGRVVLASCWSANTTVLPGREFISLPTTFLRTGSRTVVSSLWRVEDATSPAFVRRLYRAFRLRAPADSLALAQRAWWRHGRPVREWAGYTAWLDGITPGPLVVRLALQLVSQLRRWSNPVRPELTSASSLRVSGARRAPPTGLAG